MKYCLFVLLLLLSACNAKKNGLISLSSPDGQIKVTVEGNRSLPMDPFTVQVKVKGYDIDAGLLQLELQADQLDSTNVRLVWSDTQHGVLTLVERDGHQKVITISGSPNQVTAIPVSI
ncbi:MAG: hypothetical protein U0T84_13460 [Chitinophagales bacterium]